MEEFLQTYKNELKGLPKSRSRLIWINTREDLDEEEIIEKIQRVQASYANEKLKRRQKYKKMKELLASAESAEERQTAEDIQRAIDIAMNQSQKALNEQKKAEEIRRNHQTRQKIRAETLKKQEQDRLREIEKGRLLQQEREATKQKEREYALMREKTRMSSTEPEIPSNNEPMATSPSVFRQIEPVQIDDDIEKFKRFLIENEPVSTSPTAKPARPTVQIADNQSSELEQYEEQEHEQSNHCPAEGSNVMTVEMVEWNPSLNKRLAKLGWCPDEIKTAICDSINKMIQKLEAEVLSNTDTRNYYFKPEAPEEKLKRLIPREVEKTYRHFYEQLDRYERRARKGHYVPTERVCKIINP